MRQVIKQLELMAQMHSKNISPAGISLMGSDLSGYSEQEILNALKKCRLEIRGFPSIADIIARVDSGHPEPQAAWSMIPRDEFASVVWTPEMREAFAVASPLISEGDTIAARMAFLETYTRLLATAKAERRRPKWEPSLGRDKSGRAAALSEALRLGKLGEKEVLTIMPNIAEFATLVPPEERKQLSQKSGPVMLGEIIANKTGGA